MNEWVILLSVVPAIEAMWASSYFFFSNQSLYVPLCIALNFLGVVAFVKAMDRGMLPSRIEKLLEKKAGKAMKRAESWFQRYGNFTLLILIALPFTGVGSYTGAFIGRVFELKGKAFYLMILCSITLSVIFGFFIGTFAGIVFNV
jgi:uncharacterized membrane protein